MCGIAGCFGIKDEKTINKMLDVLTHRGPNDRGLFSSDQCTLGHTRLSIVDVATGHQPILSADGKKGIVVNGEIYNFKKIRPTLTPTYDFKTNSDSETVLHLYQEKGSDCVKELDGMFAFAIFDGDTFMLARDPIGIKPLYYGFKNGNMYFTSELGAMSFAGLDEVHEFPAGQYYTPEQGFVQYYKFLKFRTM